MSKRCLVCFMLVVCTAIGSGCHRRHLLREHRYYHRNGIPYQNVPSDSCSCVGTGASTSFVVPPGPAPLEMMPAPKAMPKATSY